MVNLLDDDGGSVGVVGKVGVAALSLAEQALDRIGRAVDTKLLHSGLRQIAYWLV